MQGALEARRAAAEPRFTMAQAILIACGMDDVALLVAHSRGRNASFTKKGPGRKHQRGKRPG